MNPVDEINILTQNTMDEETETRIVSIAFDKFDIKVGVGPSNEFLGIISIGINKDFLSMEQRIHKYGSHNIDDLYEE